MIVNSAEIFNIKTESDFNNLALRIYNFQKSHIPVYAAFVEYLNAGQEPKHYTEIPFLPIDFFKRHIIAPENTLKEIVFSSSGTTGQSTSKHIVTDVELYRQSYTKGFYEFYGYVQNYCILALLPNYLEREGSSLIYMVEDLIKQSGHPKSGFLLYNHEDLYQKLQQLKAEKQKTILIGVTYALLDFVEKYRLDFPELIVMETGGMKGKRKEMIREELHQLLCQGFGVSSIHSEYGMTELLSQAYSKGNGIFKCPPWMKILTRDINDPLNVLETNKTGGINVIDLANLNSCAFIATQDLGKKLPDNQFEILGRFDNSDIRGCNLLVG